MLGNNIYFACPKCGNILYRGTLLSANTYRETKYSDGKAIAPMYWEFPQISKCEKCNNIFWLDEINETQIKNDIKVQKSEFLNIDDLKRALDEDLYQTKNSEIFLRRQLIFSFNDRIRDNKDLITSLKEENIWFDNINRLMKLLSYDDINETFLLVELNRYLYRFRKSKEILQTIKDREYNILISQFENAIREKNNLVFKITYFK